MSYDAARLALALYNSTKPEATSAERAWGIYVHDKLAGLLYGCDRNSSDGRQWDEALAAGVASDCLGRLFTVASAEFDAEEASAEQE